MLNLNQEVTASAIRELKNFFSDVNSGKIKKFGLRNMIMSRMLHGGNHPFHRLLRGEFESPVEIQLCLVKILGSQWARRDWGVQETCSFLLDVFPEDLKEENEKEDAKRILQYIEAFFAFSTM